MRAWIAIAVTVALAGCSRQPDGTSQTAQGASEALSPRQTLTRMLAIHGSGEYQKLEPLVCPGRTAEIAATLSAVDDFLTANRLLCDYLRDNVGLGLAQTVDQSFLSHNLGVFSPYIELLDETIDGDTARVSFVVDEQLPAKRATLRRVDGVWRYDPGPGYDPRLPKAFHRMARGLRLVLDDLKRGRLSVEQIRDDPELLMEEVRVRLLPGVKMLPAPPNSERDGGN